MLCIQSKKGKGTYKNKTNSSSLTVISTKLTLRCKYLLGPMKSEFWVNSSFVVNRSLCVRKMILNNWQELGQPGRCFTLFDSKTL